MRRVSVRREAFYIAKKTKANGRPHQMKRGRTIVFTGSAYHSEETV